MSRKFARGEGADGLFLKTLTECIGRLGAIDPTKKQALIEMFHAELAKNPRVAENPGAAMRHEGTILERMSTSKPVELAPEPVLLKPDVTVPSPEDIEANPIKLGDFTIADFGINEDDLKLAPENPYLVDGQLQNLLKEWMGAKNHPFIHTIMINVDKKPKKFLVVGTAVVHGQNGNSININCTTGSAKKIRECDETILVHHDGRPVSVNDDAQNGAFFVWLCHFTPGKVYRFWMNCQVDGKRKDDPRGTFRILLTTNDACGWRKVAA